MSIHQKILGRHLGNVRMPTLQDKQTGKVLIIDDNLDICTELSTGLKNNRYLAGHIHVRSGMSGQDLAKSIRNALRNEDHGGYPIDLILWDVNLGGYNNGPAWALKIDDFMKEGMLPYALSEIYTGIDTTAQIREMLSEAQFFFPPNGYTKSGVMPIDRFAKILFGRIGEARTCRAHLKALLEYNERLNTICQNIVAAQSRLPSIGLEHQCADELMEIMNLLDSGLEMDLAEKIKPYEIKSLAEDLKGIKAARIINEGGDKRSEQIPIDIDGTSASGSVLEPKYRSLPAIIKSAMGEFAMYTKGTQKIVLARKDEVLGIYLSTNLVPGAEKEREEIESVYEGLVGRIKILGPEAGVEKPQLSQDPAQKTSVYRYKINVPLKK